MNAPLDDLTRLTLDASFAKDAERAREGQREHSASALRRRAVAASNGHATGGPGLPSEGDRDRAEKEATE